MNIRSIAICPNLQKPKAIREVSRLKAWIKRKGIFALAPHQIKKADAAIILGGDGTILKWAPDLARLGTPVFSVNVGHLGFLTTVEVKHLYRSLEEWLQGRWVVSERMLLEVTAPRTKKPLLALNDAVIRLKASNRVTKIQASINNEKLAVFTGDGVIVATTTGSTAYSLSAQGPVVHPDVEAMILTPICPHSFSQKPLVFPSHHVMELQMSDRRDKNQVQLCMDGQRIYPLKCGDRLHIRRSPYKLKLIQDPKISYFGVLRDKLHWGGR